MDYETDWAEYMQRARSVIVLGLNYEEESIKKKYLWLKDKYNKALTDILIKNYNERFGILLEKIK